MRSPTWETRPELALAAIDRMRLSPDGAAPARQNAARADVREAAAAAIAEALGGRSRRAGAVPGRRARRRSVAAGARADQDQRHPHGPRGPHDDARARSADGRRGRVRRASRTSASCAATSSTPSSPTRARSRPPSASGGPTTRSSAGSSRPSCSSASRPPLATWPARSTHGQALGAGDTLAGLPGCPGAVEGVARVMLDPSDPTALEPGDVLVAPITDPSWTPLFVPAAAVVVDVGALQSHAVIVSRELGIPCVVSATGATKAHPRRRAGAGRRRGRHRHGPGSLTSRPERGGASRGPLDRRHRPEREVPAPLAGERRRGDARPRVAALVELGPRRPGRVGLARTPTCGRHLRHARVRPRPQQQHRGASAATSTSTCR